MSSPIPVPFPGGFVGKKASNTRDWISGGMAGPSSSTSTAARPPSVRVGRVRGGGGSGQASSAHTLDTGARVRIAAIDGLALTVLPADEKNEEEDHG